MINVGENAPLFCLPNQDSIEVCLRDLIGKWIVLYFYPKDNTAGCTTQACDFSVSLSEFIDLNATILGVSPDSPKSHQNFIVKKDLTITLLSDEAKNVCEQYGVWQQKKLYGREYMGVVRTTYLIDPAGKIAHRWDNVKVKGHIESVKERLKDLIN